jgi:hypothetical protein
MEQQINAKKAESLLQLFDFPQEQKGFGTKECILTLPDLALQVGLKRIRLDNARDIDQFTFKGGVIKFKSAIIRDSNHILKYQQPGTKKDPYFIDQIEDALPKIAYNYINIAYFESLITSVKSIEKPSDSEFVVNSMHNFGVVDKLDYEANLMAIIMYRSILLGLKNQSIYTNENLPNVAESQILLKSYRDELYLTSNKFQSDSN